MADAVPRATLTKKFHSRELYRILPDLLELAEVRLIRSGLAPSRVGLDKLIALVVQRVVEIAHMGVPPWELGTDFETHLLRLTWLWVDYWRHRNKLGKDPTPELFARMMTSEARRAEARDGARVVEALEKDLAADEDARALYRLIAGGPLYYTRSRQAVALDWTEKRLDATRVRLRRHLEAARAHPSGDDERTTEADPLLILRCLDDVLAEKVPPHCELTGVGTWASVHQGELLDTLRARVDELEAERRRRPPAKEPPVPPPAPPAPAPVRAPEERRGALARLRDRLRRAPRKKERHDDGGPVSHRVPDLPVLWAERAPWLLVLGSGLVAAYLLSNLLWVLVGPRGRHPLRIARAPRPPAVTAPAPPPSSAPPAPGVTPRTGQLP